jgi:hypothetical protein
MSVKATVKSVQGGTLEFGTVTSSNPASIAAGAVGTATLTISGADTGDLVFVSSRAIATGLVVVEAYVSAANTVTIGLYNPTGSGVDDAASDFDYMLVKVAA